jgi:HAD superfamily hydrolase (TIGR01549 family)
MKQQLRKKLCEYKLIILDMDGTLYYQAPLRFYMCIELMLYYAVHLRRIAELFMLYRFRKSYESGVLEQGNSVTEYWMQERPLRYISRFRDKKLIFLIRRLREQGAKIAVYSDYPVQQKLTALPDLTAAYYFCAADPAIQCLKPDPAGLKNILRITEETAENSLFIGDRYEKDGKCAENAGVDYIILDNNHLMRNINLYKKEPVYAGNAKEK